MLRGVTAGILLMALVPLACLGQAGESVAGAGSSHPGRPPEAEQTLLVPVSTSVEAPVAYAADLTAGQRLLIEAAGEVGGLRPDTEGGIGVGALIASFAGGPAFLVGTGRLLWTAPGDGRLAFAVEQRGGGRLTGSYSVRIIPLGLSGDPRQRAFPPPWIAFLPRVDGGPFLAVRYDDRGGFGLDLKTLQVLLDTEAGERVVLSPYFIPDSGGAVLPAVPPEVHLPPGVHRVRATIGDALGNVSPAAEIFLDQP
jgi:hypothetical protein